MPLTTTDYLSILPTTILAVWAMALMLIDLVLKRKAIIAGLSLLGFVVAGVVTLALWNQRGHGFNDMVALDPYALFFGLVGIAAGALAVLQSFNYLRDRGIARSEYYALLMFSVSGITLMASANNLIIVFIALEIVSIPLYVLSGFAWPGVQSEEAAMKYFLLGAFSSSFLLFGIALIYGASGTTDLTVLAQNPIRSPLLLIGAGLLLVGLGFKVAVVPFHMWTPDVYEGAPTPVTGFMSVGAKVAGFAALVRVFVFALGALQADWVQIIAILAALTMILGNVVAIMQNNLKRMLGYSSIAHAGYILMGVAAAGGEGRDLGVAGAMFYLLAYAFTNLGAFAVLAMLASKDGEDQSFSAYRGLARRNLPAAAAMTFFMLSLTGIPLTGGFTGKYYLFWSAVQSNLVWLAIVGVLTSVVSAFYYLRVVIEMFMREPEGEIVQPVRYESLRVSLWLTALATLALGVLPSGVLALVQQATRLLLGA